MTTFYKVLTPDLRDFHSGEYQYTQGTTHRPGTPDRATYELPSMDLLHASVSPEHAARFGRWPYRLFAVHGDPVAAEGTKVGFRELYLGVELPVARCFGPNGQAVVALLDELAGWSPGQWDAAWYADDWSALSAWWRVVQAAVIDLGRDVASSVAAAAVLRSCPTEIYSLLAQTWVAALLVADTIDTYGITQQGIDTLLAPYHAGRAAAS